ncbi:MAG: CRTAC1 family protein [Acidobacteriota bacterium]
MLFAQIAWADGGVVFQDIAADGGAGLSYSRVRSDSDVKFDILRDAGIFFFFDIGDTPLKSRGAPGVAILDYDDDGDLDLYVTNGPLTPNSLFSNQLAETGELTFVDVAISAGVDVSDQDSTGVCFGDTDNDGDADLLVLSGFEPNRLFENNGDGTFTDLASSSGLSDDNKSSVACTFGDVNNDGLLDVYIANCCLDMNNQFATGTAEPFAFNQHSQLYLNTGGNVFVDVSATSGIEDQKGFPPGFDGSPGVTWAAGMVDYDLDGDIDIITAEDQAAVPLARDGGTDRGLIHLFDNDGTGHFTDLTVSAGLNRAGAWMGLSFGDINADGHLDLFGSNLGDYATTLLTPLDPVYGDFVNYQLGDMTSRWYLGSASGAFIDPGMGDIVATPFGWGTSMEDYDNDGDTDIIYHGGLLPGPVVQGAPGIILRNDGQANFTRDTAALADSTDHERRTVQGVAMGDLNNDGFSDIVSVSNFDIPATAALSTYNHNWGSPFDGGRYFQFFEPTDTPLVTTFSGVLFENGTLSVEINSADNGKGSATVELLGTVGLTSEGSVNRDGIGAMVKFRTSRGKRAMKPVLGGSSYASQDSLELVFGMDRARRGRVDVLWPGGVRNRLYGVKRGEEIIFPEIPCDIAGSWASFFQYAVCVGSSLHELRDAGIINRREKGRFFASAIVAFIEEH